MFVRRRHNRSGTVSVVVVDKQKGVYREIRTIGTSSEEMEVSEFIEQGKYWIHQQKALPDIFDTCERKQAEQETIAYFFNHIEKMELN